MIVLGIETSCDETSAALVRDGKELLSLVTATSMDLHAAYGGVVPEIAARSHIESIIPIIDQALREASLHEIGDRGSKIEEDPWELVDAIAVTYGAGLGGSLLVGVMTARTLAIAKNKPLYAINHVEGHVYANFLTSTGTLLAAKEQGSLHRKSSLDDTVLPVPLLSRSSKTTASSDAHKRLVSSQSPALVHPNKHRSQSLDLRGSRSMSKIQDPRSKINYNLPEKQPEFPLLALIVSGGHSQLVLFRDHFDYTLLGQTQDDAIGEAFDKVAKITGLPYPGGPSIAEKALEGDAHKYALPKSQLTGVSEQLIELRSQALDLRETSGTKAPSSKPKSPRSKLQAPRSNISYDFSFSGLKTAVLRLAQGLIGQDHTFPSHKLPERLSEAQKADIAASFQRVAIETVVDKTIQAYQEFQPKSVVIAGGVAANAELRKQLNYRLQSLLLNQKSSNINYQVSDILSFTDPKLCTDNGAMIATLGCYKAMLHQPTADPYSLEIQPNLSM